MRAVICVDMATKNRPEREGEIEVRSLPPQVVRDYDSALVIEPGEYLLYAGGSQPADKKAPAKVLQSSFTITGETTPLSSCT